MAKVKVSRPNNDDEVYDVMAKYCEQKGFKFRDAQLRYMAEQCYLLHEGRGWAGCKYWPALAMKYILTTVGSKQGEIPINKTKGKTVKESIMEQEKE